MGFPYLEGSPLRGSLNITATRTGDQKLKLSDLAYRGAALLMRHTTYYAGLKRERDIPTEK